MTARDISKNERDIAFSFQRWNLESNLTELFHIHSFCSCVINQKVTHFFIIKLILPIYVHEGLMVTRK